MSHSLNQCDQVIRRGLTSEGMRCVVELWYAKGSPSNAMPVWISGNYLSIQNGFSVFGVKEQKLLPFTVKDGDW